jgi:hypothetical protein
MIFMNDHHDEVVEEADLVKIIVLLEKIIHQVIMIELVELNQHFEQLVHEQLFHEHERLLHEHERLAHEHERLAHELEK